MTRCITCGKRDITLGVNAILAYPANWNDKRLECDECAGVVRDEQGKIIFIKELETKTERVQQ